MISKSKKFIFKSFAVIFSVITIFTVIAPQTFCTERTPAKRRRIEHSAQNLDQSLIYSAAFNTLSNCKNLTIFGANVNARGWGGTTPLHAASSQCRNDICRWLLQQNANVNAKTDEGITPLHIAPYFDDNWELCKLLIDNHAIINDTDNIYKRTALHWAAARGHLKSCEVLLENGAKIDIEDMHGDTPYNLAQKNLELKKLFDKYKNNPKNLSQRV